MESDLWVQWHDSQAANGTEYLSGKAIGLPKCTYMIVLKSRAQSGLCGGEVAPLIPRHPWSLAVFFKINLLTKLLKGTRLCNAGISCISCVFGPSAGFFLSLLRFYGWHNAWLFAAKVNFRASLTNLLSRWNLNVSSSPSYMWRQK